MRTRLTLRPGQKGTKHLTEEYGDRLICVRYRYDAVHNVRFKTVELIVGEVPWAYCRPWRCVPSDRKVLVAIRPDERELQAELKAAGASWRPEHRAWEVSYEAAERLGIHGLVLLERAPRAKGRGPWREKPADSQGGHIPPYAR